MRTRGSLTSGAPRRERHPQRPPSARSVLLRPALYPRCRCLPRAPTRIRRRPCVRELRDGNGTRVSVSHPLRLSPSLSPAWSVARQQPLGQRRASRASLPVFCGFVRLSAATSLPAAAASSSSCRPARPDALSPRARPRPAVCSSPLPSVPSSCPVCDSWTRFRPFPRSAPPAPWQRSVGKGSRWAGPRNAVSFLIVCPRLAVPLVEEEKQLWERPIAVRTSSNTLFPAPKRKSYCTTVPLTEVHDRAQFCLEKSCHHP